jgi:hypothetical protein
MLLMTERRIIRMAEILTNTSTTFAHPFSSRGVEGAFPAGTYAVETTEERLNGLTSARQPRWDRSRHIASYDGAPANGAAWTGYCSTTSEFAARGASWNDKPQVLRSAFRGGETPQYRDFSLGFPSREDTCALIPYILATIADVRNARLEIMSDEAADVATVPPGDN